MKKLLSLLIIPLFFSCHNTTEKFKNQVEEIKGQKEILQLDIPLGWKEIPISNQWVETWKALISEEIDERLKKTPIEETMIFYYRQEDLNFETISPEIRCMLVPLNRVNTQTTQEDMEEIVDEVLLLLKEFRPKLIQEPIPFEISGKPGWHYAIEVPGQYKAFGYYIIEDGYYYLLSFIDVPDYNNSSVFEAALENISFKLME